MGIGDWGLGIGDWGLQSPIPNPQSPYYSLFFIKIYYSIYNKFILQIYNKLITFNNIFI